MLKRTAGLYVFLLFVCVSEVYSGPRRPIDIDEMTDREACAEYVRQQYGFSDHRRSARTRGSYADCMQRLGAGGYESARFRAYLLMDDAKRVKTAHEYASRGVAQAQFDLSSLLNDEYVSANESYSNKSADDWLKKAAGNGHREAQRKLGSIRQKEQRVERAVYWYTKAAQAGDSIAQARLGRLYRIGQGTEKNLSEAVHWLEMASDKVPLAKGELGWMYEAGLGVKRDLKKAASYYREAAGRVPEARYRLGLLYREGEGVERSADEAFDWVRKAVMEGGWDSDQRFTDDPSADATATFELAKMYDSGMGVTKDREKARYWYAEASRLGHEDAHKRLKDLRRTN